ncbi:hypothetical protein [Pseudonocardia sp. KRD291]|uniref:hypothetical protein n=1 Tax=Pseudonocardia sp. KRD291 TaxID=2792007 RepID=UPI001C4A2C19|nr:hypothetical protein [Pseudonocardia sp. KRD291]MBW0105302.1 hypothetical protein [Pseudonocardia sp. KRD291]
MTQALAEREPDALTGTEAEPEPSIDNKERLKNSFQALLVAVVDKVAGVALSKVDDLAGSLEDVTARGGVGLAAALGAGKALLAGTNPVWGAVKAGFAALGTLAKTLVIVGLALSPVLLIVLALLLVVALLVLAIVLAIRAATR